MKRIASCFALLCLWVGMAHASEPITIGETITVHSKILGEERTILVSTPADYDQSPARYPVLYMTDGDAHLTHTRGTVDFLVRNGLMPPVIIVGVTNTDRTRDLSPTNATMTDDGGVEGSGPAESREDAYRRLGRSFAPYGVGDADLSRTFMILMSTL